MNISHTNSMTQMYYIDNFTIISMQCIYLYYYLEQVVLKHMYVNFIQILSGVII